MRAKLATLVAVTGFAVVAAIGPVSFGDAAGGCRIERPNCHRYDTAIDNYLHSQQPAGFGLYTTDGRHTTPYPYTINGINP